LTVKGLDDGLRLLLPPQKCGVSILEAYEARRGTPVRVREGHWKAEFAGMLGTVKECWGQSGHAAVDVLLEDRRSELFWLTDLEVVEGAIAV
jgi:hypothetical protein